MDTEYEVRILDVDKEQMVKKLEELGAQKVGEWLQRRFTFEQNPPEEHTWIRLRTNGELTTLAYKTIKSDTIDGTKELEVEVNDFEKTRELLLRAGLQSRRYEENYRTRYMLDGVELDIDSWPLIPTYMEIEGKNKEEIYKIINKLNIEESKITALNAQDIFIKVYNIDILKMKELRF